MTTLLSYTDFKTLRINFHNNQPTYLQNLESDFESSTKFAYKFYLNGRVPVYAKQMDKKEIIKILKSFEQRDFKRGGVSICPKMYNAIADKIKSHEQTN